MAVILRPAVAEDQPAITMIVRAAWLNPLSLDWQRFLVAEESGGLIGVGQIKPHRDGSRELASIAVVPEWQGLGVGAAIVGGLLARASGVLHLICASTNAPFYERFGFQPIERAQMPAYFRRIARLAKLIGFFARNHGAGLVVMRREAEVRGQMSGTRRYGDKITR